MQSSIINLLWISSLFSRNSCHFKYHNQRKSNLRPWICASWWNHYASFCWRHFRLSRKLPDTAVRLLLLTSTDGSKSDYITICSCFSRIHFSFFLCPSAFFHFISSVSCIAAAFLVSYPKLWGILVCRNNSLTHAQHRLLWLWDLSKWFPFLLALMLHVFSCNLYK